MLVDTGKRLPWTFTGQTVSTAFSLPLEEILTRELKVTYEAGRESLFRPVLPALEDPALQRHGHTDYVNLGLEISRDYVLGGLGKGRWVLIELVLRERSNELQGYLLEMVDVQDASTRPEWLAEYRRQKKARR
ncbi:hypothetical protein [Melittangium boletus]|uniref:Uncharacterized protein n=1 Tax=Melittangium boletus DSM 14713 TaxID=1294270 RepID=A0A250IM93_9BACT|nr:hypothetical protein [Melittangium boletus]ATB32875.1 hypothetical protein MEBOL_006364 [Melittangium boletus DSM 14713]